MLGNRFSKYTPPPDSEKSDFEKLLKIFMQLILITSGNVSEALQWLTEVDKQYNLTNSNYGIGDFIEDLKKKRDEANDEKAKSQFQNAMNAFEEAKKQGFGLEKK